MKTLICQYCGKTFNPTRTNQKFCSHKCASDSKIILIQKECAYCGKIIIDIPKRIKKQKYCSYDCLNRAKVKDPRRFDPISCKFCKKQFIPYPKNRIYCSLECKYKDIAVKKINCQFCQKPFKPIKHKRMFCSDACAKKSQQANKVPLTIFYCQYCGKEILDYPRTNRKYCSNKCHGLASTAFKKGERNIRWKGGRRPGYRGPNWKEQSAQARIRDNYTCQVCGHYQISPFLVVHHIKAYRDFDGDYESANNLSNLITLCQNCHSKLEGRSAKGVKGWIKLK